MAIISPSAARKLWTFAATCRADAAAAGLFFAVVDALLFAASCPSEDCATHSAASSAVTKFRYRYTCSPPRLTRAW